MENEKKTTFGDRLEMAFRKLIRLIGILIIIAGVAAAIYFGTPFLYEKLVMPIEDNTARLSEIDGDLEASTDLLTRQISDLQSRQIEFENLLTENTNDMTELSSQIQILEQEIEAHNLTLSQLEDIQDALDALESCFS